MGQCSIRTPGNQGALLLRADGCDGQVEFTLLTFWADWDAITAFAGGDVSTAVLYPEDLACAGTRGRCGLASSGVVMAGGIRLARVASERRAERSAASRLVPCQVGAECSDEPGDCFARGLVADAVG
jgi:hypothetical protein